MSLHLRNDAVVVSMGFYGVYGSMGIYEFLWVSWVSIGFWMSMGIHRYLRVFMGVHGVYGFTGFWVSMGTYRCDQALIIPSPPRGRQQVVIIPSSSRGRHRTLIISSSSTKRHQAQFL